MCAFFRFLLFFDFFKLYLEKTINIAVVGNVPGNVFPFFFQASVVWPFWVVLASEQSTLLSVPSANISEICFDYFSWFLFLEPAGLTFSLSAISGWLLVGGRAAGAASGGCLGLRQLYTAHWAKVTLSHSVKMLQLSPVCTATWHCHCNASDINHFHMQILNFSINV